MALETLVQDEVVVTLEGMSVNAGIVVAVIGNETLQLHRRLWQALDGEGHVLDQARGTHWARASYRGEDARADGPIFAVDGRIFSELCRDIQSELA